MGKKILYIFDAGDWNSRIPVAYASKEKGFEVIIGLIGDPHLSSDFEIYPIRKPPSSKSIHMMLTDVYNLLKKIQPDMLHVVTLKYAFLCGFVALKFPNMRKIYTLAGLGYVFYDHSPQALLLRAILKPFLMALFRCKNTLLIFQNPDDLNLMVKNYYSNAQQSILIRGSGVDLHKFNIFIKPDEPPIVLMPTRLIREKGVQVFIDAAKILKARKIDAKFQIAGGETTHNPKAISRDEMLRMTKFSNVEWLGRVNDIPNLLAHTTLVVYPSYYGEGIPRVLLEACAAGKAIVTTDHTGCREAVSHGINGLLVPIKNPEATADAIEMLLKDRHRREKMAQLSRKRAENEFDIQLIAKKTAEVYSI